MQLIKRIFAWLVPVLFLSGGLICLLSASFFQWTGMPNSVIMLVLLGFFNFLVALKFKMLPRLKTVLSLKKIYYLPIGFVIGILPKLMSYFVGAGFGLQGVVMNSVFLASVVTTLSIVTWEELWFRGLVLDLAASKYTQIGASVVFSIMFVLLHALNPEINLLEAAPDLFWASMLLSLSYFVFESLWAPVGIHFANNFFETLWQFKSTPSTVGLVATELVLVILLSIVLVKKQQRTL